MNKRELIKNITIFSNVSGDSLDRLERIVQKVDFNPGNIIFSEGETADALYILKKGAVDLIKSSPSGREQLIRAVGVGEMFAEAAMFSGENYPATAIVKENSSLLVIKKDDFLKFIRLHPEVSMNIMGAMAKLLHHLNALVANLALGSVASRLASYLIESAELAKSSTFKLEIKKRDLAFQLGTISETLSRNLKKFKDDGLIDIHRSTIRIKNSARLKELASGK